MKPTLTLTLIALVILAACSRANPEAASSVIRSAQAAEARAPLYPPLRPDAQDGAVFDYY
jgi:hypothetical protein